MLPSKMAFMFFYGSHACNLMYLNVFFTSIGLTATQAGQITGLQAISSLIGALLWGIIADYTGRRKVLMLLLSTGLICLIFPLSWVAGYVNNLVAQNGANITSSFNRTENTLHPKYCTTECGDNTMFYTMMIFMVL